MASHATALMAVVQTKRDQFGNAEGAFEINKPVMLEPATPRFANVGDAGRAPRSRSQHDAASRRGDATVRIQLDAHRERGGNGAHGEAFRRRARSRWISLMEIRETG